MFTINGAPILHDDVEIVLELRDQLAINGIHLFRTIKVAENNIQITCPIHNEGRERHPSCGISRTDQKHVNGQIIPAGTVHCFSCGYTAALHEMVSHCFGKDDYGDFGKKWLLKNFQSISIETRQPIILESRNMETKKEPIKYVPDTELDSYRYYHDYMWERKLTEDIVEKFDIGYDPNFVLKDNKDRITGNFECLTFPVRDYTGGTLFVARRAIYSKLFYYPTSVKKPVYGIYELGKYLTEYPEIIVCESIINALTCWTHGRPAVALLGLGTTFQYEQLLKLKSRKFIAAFDPDLAGRRAQDKFKRYISKKRLVTNYELPEGKDINDLTKKEFQDLVEFF